MTWGTTRISVAHTAGFGQPSIQRVWPPPPSKPECGSVRNGLLVSFEREPFNVGNRQVVLSAAASQIRLDGRTCMLVVVEVANADPYLPLPTDATFGTWKVVFQGCHALPVYGLSHGGSLETYVPQETYIWELPKWNHDGLGIGTSIPTHTCRGMRFLVAQPEATESQLDCLRWLTNVCLSGSWSQAAFNPAINGEPDGFELPVRQSVPNELEVLLPEAGFAWSQSNPKNLWGFRKEPSGPGDDGEWGSDPWPQLRASSVPAYNLDRRLLGYANHQPMWIYDREYVATPDERAWKFTGSLSDHSRNRKGLPHRSEWAELQQYKKGWLCDADGIEHTAHPALHLAWCTGDPYWCEKAIDYGYHILNTIHSSRVPIAQGGYDSHVMPVPRYYRMVVALIQATLVARKWGAVFPRALDDAKVFEESLCRYVDEVAESTWRQLGYPDWVIAERPDGLVDGKAAVAVWQGGFPIQAFWWIGRNLGIDSDGVTNEVGIRAMGLVAEWARMILASWSFNASANQWEMGKLLQATPLSSPGWPEAPREYVHVSLDGLVYWPYAGLKLVEQWNPELLSQVERVKLSVVIAWLERRWPDLVTGRWGNIGGP